MKPYWIHTANNMPWAGEGDNYILPVAKCCWALVLSNFLSGKHFGGINEIILIMLIHLDMLVQANFTANRENYL